MIAGLYVANQVEGLVCVFMTQYILTRNWRWSEWTAISFKTSKEVVAYLGSAVLGNLLGAVIGSASLHFSGDADIGFGLILLRWFSSNGLVLFTLTPAILYIPQLIKGIQEQRKKRWRFRHTVIILQLFVLPVPLWISSTLREVAFSSILGLFVVFPILIGIQFYVNTTLTILENFYVSFVSLLFIILFKKEHTLLVSFEEKVATVTLFLMLMAATCLLISAILNERDTAMENIEEQVRARTRELMQTMKDLKVAKNTSEKMNKQKSVFLVSLVGSRVKD